MNRFIKSVITGLGVFGSAFIKKTADGKYELAIAPFALIAVVGSGVACAAQSDETFSVCLKSTLATVKEVIYAD